MSGLAVSQRNDRQSIDFDLKWREVERAPEPVQGMSESLATGLVNRFVKEWAEADATAVLRRPPPQKTKRAAAYRATVEWLRGSVPRNLHIEANQDGAQTGLDKSGAFYLMYWGPSPRAGWMEVVISFVLARKVGIETGVVLHVSHHALVRLFQRLKTADQLTVLAEARVAVQSFWIVQRVWLVQLARPDILIPSPGGALAIGADSESDRGAVAKTWMSNARMAADPRRLTAVDSAREEGGFVLMADGHFVVVSAARAGAQPTGESLESCIRAQLPHRLVRERTGRFSGSHHADAEDASRSTRL